MTAYKTIVKQEGLNVQIVSLGGHVASYETPSVKVTVVAGGPADASAAWVQVLRLDKESRTVSSEGWFDSRKSSFAGLTVTVAEHQPDDKEQSCLAKLKFSATTDSCCTSGNVKCCGGCCRDGTTGYGCCP